MQIPSSHYRSDRDRDQGVMTPMIDVVFLLLVFFVVAAAGQVQESVMPTRLPDVGGAIEMPLPAVEDRDVWADQVWVGLLVDEGSGETHADVNGTIYDDLSRMTGVLSQLGELSAGSPIILDIDGPVPWGDVIYVWDACRAAGFESINFAADAPGGGAPSVPGE